MSKTASERAQDIINSVPQKKSGFVWLEFCNSPTAFIKTWELGRAGRRLAMLAAQNSKTAARGAPEFDSLSQKLTENAYPGFDRTRG
ncbi:hypothetical protein [Thiomonas sp. CB2]|uniref:hypothetical protein n=2 Tax=Thiomonas TaxID=32012 RepID=UPI0012DDEAA4|nr:hypothetical protein [Thiomonas sp. CB2]